MSLYLIGDIFRDAILYFNYLAIFYYGITNGFYAIFVISAIYITFRHLQRLSYGHLQNIASSRSTPPISIIVAAFNEVNILKGVRALLTLDYPEYEVIVVNDGSADQTLERLIKGFNLIATDYIYQPVIKTQPIRRFYKNSSLPMLTVVDKSHGGKGDALNVGVNVCSYPYFCSVDADSILEKDALLRLIRPIIESANPHSIAGTGGIVRIVNGCRLNNGHIVDVALPPDSLCRFQVVEYLRSFLFGRAGWSVFNSLLVLSGTISMFHKTLIQKIGGYSITSVTEDMELVVRLHRFLRLHKHKYRISFVHDPICWTEVPTTFKMLARQRRRWHRGLMESLLANLRMLFNPRYKQVGLLAFPYHLFIETFGPIVELVGYLVVACSYFLGIIEFSFFMLFIILAIVFGTFLSTAAILLEEFTFRRYPRWTDLAILMAYGFLENFGYRQLNAWWRLQALVQIMKKRRWEHVRKEGVTYSQEMDSPVKDIAGTESGQKKT
jgi:cellulose synthase/poly-beta-1,6-N-acetylglucosamine synthase-like glycosyltransferase